MGAKWKEAKRSGALDISFLVSFGRVVVLPAFSTATAKRRPVFRLAEIQFWTFAGKRLGCRATWNEIHGPMLEAISMKDFYSCGVPQSFLVCEDDISRGPGHWHPNFSSRLHNPTLGSVKSGHEVMFTAPVQCARALHELAAG
jgi:hypothetical protein